MRLTFSFLLHGLASTSWTPRPCQTTRTSQTVSFLGQRLSLGQRLHPRQLLPRDHCHQDGQVLPIEERLHLGQLLPAKERLCLGQLLPLEQRLLLGQLLPLEQCHHLGQLLPVKERLRLG